MKAKLLISIALCSMMIGLTGCSHEHVWAEATCQEPKTCSECGETEGEALGHQWLEATCKEAKHCKVCGETEGKAVEHQWVDATCEKAKYCKLCNETEGKPLEHEWAEATRTTPKTCTLCGKIEGGVLLSYFEENNITCESLEDIDLPFAMAYLEDGKEIECDGLWADECVAHYTFGEITSEPAEEEGYIKITLPYEVSLSALMYEDDSKSWPDDYTFVYEIAGLVAGDYYTGLVVPNRASFGGETVEDSKEYQWGGETYSIKFSSELIWGNDSFSDWKQAGKDIYYDQYKITGKVIKTIVIPEGYDGAVLYMKRNGPEKVSLEGTTEESMEDKYFLDDGTPEEFIFYRLSDIMNK